MLTNYRRYPHLFSWDTFFAPRATIRKTLRTIPPTVCFAREFIVFLVRRISRILYEYFTLMFYACDVGKILKEGSESSEYRTVLFCKFRSQLTKCVFVFNIEMYLNYNSVRVSRVPCLNCFNSVPECCRIR